MKLHQTLHVTVCCVLLVNACKKEVAPVSTPPHQDTTQPYVATCYVTGYTDHELHRKFNSYELSYDSLNRFQFIETENPITGTLSGRKPISIIRKDAAIVIVQAYAGHANNTYDSFVVNRAGQVIYHYFTDSTFISTEYFPTYDNSGQLSSMLVQTDRGSDQLHYYKWQDGDLMLDSIDGRSVSTAFTYYTDRLASPASPMALQDLITYGIVQIKSKHLAKAGGILQTNGFSYKILDNRYSFYGDGSVATDTVILPADTVIRKFAYFCK